MRKAGVQAPSEVLKCVKVRGKNWKLIYRSLKIFEYKSLLSLWTSESDAVFAVKVEGPLRTRMMGHDSLELVDFVNLRTTLMFYNVGLRLRLEHQGLFKIRDFERVLLEWS